MGAMLLCNDCMQRYRPSKMIEQDRLAGMQAFFSALSLHGESYTMCRGASHMRKHKSAAVKAILKVQPHKLSRERSFGGDGLCRLVPRRRY